MRYAAKEIKSLTGKPIRAEGETALYAGLEDREWHFGGRSYQIAGYDRRKDLVHFTATWPAGTGFGHSRLGLPLRLAVEGGGNLAAATVLH